MEKIPTAAEYIYNRDRGEGEEWCRNSGTLALALIEFAKLHIENALKIASERACAYGEGSSLNTNDSNFFYTFAGHIGKIKINKDSILNAYPASNVK